MFNTVNPFKFYLVTANIYFLYVDFINKYILDNWTAYMPNNFMSGVSFSVPSPLASVLISSTYLRNTSH